MTESIVKIAERIMPDQVTLVPEKRAELTTEGGLDCVKYRKRLHEVVRRMHKKGVLVEVSADVPKVRYGNEVDVAPAAGANPRQVPRPDREDVSRADPDLAGPALVALYGRGLKKLSP